MVNDILRAFLARAIGTCFIFGLIGPLALAQAEDQAQSPDSAARSIVFKVKHLSQRMEMTVNTSRILSLDQKIPTAQVNNPDILDLVALSPHEVQVSAKKPGVTQVNLWGEDKKIYTIDIIVFGDAQELTMVLETQFPNATIKVVPVASGVLLNGFVDHPEHVNQIIQIAEEYYPKVISNITVGGVQQVLLHLKVMEVSRSKLRDLGFDFAKITGSSLVASSVSGILSSVGSGGPTSSSGQTTLLFNIVEGTSGFYGLLQALREDSLMKILAEPTLVTVSGRPAYFLVGGEVPTLVPQSLGTVSVEYKRYGTQVDFVPIVLGNGRIRLEVRPKVSDIDNGRSIQYQGFTIYAFNSREVDTGVELQAGETLAIAGLVQDRMESDRRAIPWVGELPYVGAMFRRVKVRKNTIELLVLVTPELVCAMPPDQVPQCGPGTQTDAPNDWEMFMRGYIEVPKCCPADSCSNCVPGMIGPAGSGIELEETEPIATPSSTESPTPPRRPVPTDAASRRGESLNRVDSSHNPQNRHDSVKRGQVTSGKAKKKLPEEIGFLGDVGYDVVQ